MNISKDTQVRIAKEVLCLIDWDNVFLGLYKILDLEKLDLDHRFKALIEWIEKNIGKLLGGHGFVFAPEHLAPCHREICVSNRLWTIICPKRLVDWCPRCETKPSQRELGAGKCSRCLQKIEKKNEDTVDETIISFGSMMLAHSNVKFLCLVSGDEDFVPLLQEAQKKHIKVALVPPTINSLAGSKKIVDLIDRHPKTGRKMILRLDQIIELNAV